MLLRFSLTLQSQEGSHLFVSLCIAALISSLCGEDLKSSTYDGAIDSKCYSA
jgi:hypothetical protein